MTQTAERPLPYNADAERSVLGAVLLENRALDSLSGIDPHSFFLDQHVRIFTRMLELSDERTPIDLITLSEKLDEHGELETAGGPAYLSQLMDGLPRVTNAEYYAQIVRQKWLLRRLARAGDMAMQLATSEADVSEAIERTLQSITEIAFDAQEAGQEIQTFRTAATALLMRLQDSKAVRIITGVSELDSNIGGFIPGELIVLVAETGVGKTIFSMQIRAKSCDRKLHTLYCSGEMDAPHLLSRELATQAEIPHWKMRNPSELEAGEIDCLVAVSQQQCVRCHILDGELTLSRIRSTARKLKSLGELDCVVVDYDELVEAPGKDDLAKQVALVRGLKSMAIELKIPVIQVSQLRKPLTGDDVARPTLARIYGSGAKTKHASIVLFVDREYVREMEGDEAKGRIIVLKNRDGRGGQIYTSFNIKRLRFEDPSPGQLDQWEREREVKRRSKNEDD